MSSISSFWLTHPEYWITTSTNQELTDRVIYDRFYNYDFSKESDLDKVIYLDQFTRHFSRIVPNYESVVQSSRLEAMKLVESIDLLSITSDKELIWYLMPWKHTNAYNRIFESVNTWLCGKSLTDFPYLNRFYKDTYHKAYTDEVVKQALTQETYNGSYDQSICDSSDSSSDSSSDTASDTIPDTTLKYDTEPLMKLLRYNKVTVSLSGGVDSMLMVTLLAQAQVDVIAVHIVYGNRQESEMECKFISTYCNKINVPLYIYRIEYLRRNTTEREFYESMTRELRFKVYKALNRPVLLGHIQEDLIENIWSNLAHGTHLDNLAKLDNEITEMGVKVCRPWLVIKKSQIYAIAKGLDVPYLKNTTPAWSNRGKFRTAFYEATHNQFGSQVDERMVEVATRLKNQALLLDKLLYDKINKTWSNEKQQLNITDAVNIELDADGWLRIFTDLAHKHLNTGMPSFKACLNFVWKLKRGLSHGQIINLKKDINLVICKVDSEIYVQINKKA